jgi:hypothetical protein
MDSQKQSIIDRLKQSNNILVTVSANPTVDQLSACVGLTIMLNELDKHATAVFSGTVPSTIEFLQPDKTIEKNTDSLRDFIIALDKSKADKLRYKVEDKVVKIFITPYRTSISEKDLEFSQGDFNVDVVVCLGVHDQRDLDQAITSHGRILHDATVIGITTTVGNSIGTLNWQDQKASSLCEMVASLVDSFDKKVLDTQVATALLTGIVAETDRFSNGKTSPDTMKVSAQLMAAGANQQLVASKLAEPTPPVEPLRGDMSTSAGSNGGSSAAPPKSNDGTLRIAHEKEDVKLPPVQEPAHDVPPPPAPPEPEAEHVPEEPQIHIDEQGQLHKIEKEDRSFLAGPGPGGEAGSTVPEDLERPSGAPTESPKFVLTPPTLGGTLTANSRPEELEPATDPLSQAAADQHQPILTHNASVASMPQVTKPVGLPEPVVAGDHAEATTDVATPIGSGTPPPDESGARNAVQEAINAAPGGEFPKARTDLSAQPLGGELHSPTTVDAKPKPAEVPKLTEPLGGLVEPLASNEPAPAAASPEAKPMDMPLPPTLMPPPAASTPPTSSNNGTPAGPPPPVPPPFMPENIKS